MRQRIFIGLIAVSILSIMGGLYIVFSLEKAVSTHNKLVELHQVEILREQLLIKIKKVQGDLSLKGTRFERKFDTLVAHVSSMSMVVDSCFDCHHSERGQIRLIALRNKADSYKLSLSRVFTFRANTSRLKKEEDNAIRIGRDLIDEVNDMIALTTRTLNAKTQAAMAEIDNSKRVLTLFILAWPLIAIGLAFMFFKSLTEPVQILLDATRKLKSGDMDHRIKGLQYEFGEVAASFNEMAGSLKEQMEKMQRTEQMVLFGEYAAKLAHEIKNPLAGIKLSVEVIAGELNLSDEHRNILTKIAPEIDRIESLLKNLLSFAKPPKPQFDFLDVNIILNNAIDFSKKHKAFISNDPGAIEIVKDFDGNLPSVQVDPQQLQQVFLNLLLNALDAMPGGGYLTVKTYYDNGIDSIQIDISDTGKGIEGEIADRIFEPFFTTKRKGTGLGLPISKQLITQNGGTISVENNRSGGTTVKITLPTRHPMEVSH
jgi:signal transduction histidine kinase